MFSMQRSLKYYDAVENNGGKGKQNVEGTRRDVKRQLLVIAINCNVHKSTCKRDRLVILRACVHFCDLKKRPTNFTVKTTL